VPSYGQYCALARALDVVGERWTLLIVRELLARDCRYSDLREALPGLATNLLAERLRRLQDHGVIESQEAPPPARATVYTLTARGRGLAPALTALVTWGAPLMVSQGGDAFRTRWMVRGLPVVFAGVDVADLAPLEVVVRTGDEPATLTIGPDGVDMRIGASSSLAAVTVEGPPDQVLALLTGTSSARLRAVRVRGPREAKRRLRLLSRRIPQRLRS
jgi:DNA-binding HxlR family transcriptional regulator